MKLVKKDKYGFRYRSDDTVGNTFPYFFRVGCVYPDNDQSYFIDSNIQEELATIYCLDGFFYGDVRSAQKLAAKQEDL